MAMHPAARRSARNAVALVLSALAAVAADDHVASRNKCRSAREDGAVGTPGPTGRRKPEAGSWVERQARDVAHVVKADV